jgi:hypothetical protein
VRVGGWRVSLKEDYDRRDAEIAEKAAERR